MKEYLHKSLIIALLLTVAPVKASSSEDNENNENEIEITVKKLDGETFTVRAPSRSTVIALKKKIEDAKNINPLLQRLIYLAKELKDTSSIDEYGLGNNSTIHLVVRRSYPSNPPIIDDKTNLSDQQNLFQKHGGKVILLCLLLVGVIVTAAYLLNASEKKSGSRSRFNGSKNKSGSRSNGSKKKKKTPIT